MNYETICGKRYIEKLTVKQLEKELKKKIKQEKLKKVTQPIDTP